jgi:hypothetical protein
VRLVSYEVERKAEVAATTPEILRLTDSLASDWV